jgi:hypothetical protein
MPGPNSSPIKSIFLGVNRASFMCGRPV